MLSLNSISSWHLPFKYRVTGMRHYIQRCTLFFLPVLGFFLSFVCVHAQTCRCVCMQRSRVNVRDFSQLFSTLPFEIGSLTDLGLTDWLEQWAVEPQGSFCPHRDSWCTPFLLHECWGSNSCPSANTASILLTAFSPAPLFFFSESLWMNKACISLSSLKL